MSKKGQYLLRVGRDWSVRGAGNKRFTNITPTKTEAEKAGIETAKNQGSELVIYGRNGKIQDKDSFGPDLYPPKDKKH